MTHRSSCLISNKSSAALQPAQGNSPKKHQHLRKGRRSRPPRALQAKMESSKMYSCPECKAQNFKSLAGVRTHFKFKSHTLTFCTECWRTFPKSDSLIQHWNQKHNRSDCTQHIHTASVESTAPRSPLSISKQSSLPESQVLSHNLPIKTAPQANISKSIMTSDTPVNPFSTQAPGLIATSVPRATPSMNQKSQPFEPSQKPISAPVAMKLPLTGPGMTPLALVI